MPFRTMTVHDDQKFMSNLTAELEGAGHTVQECRNPMVALDALEADPEIRVIVTRVRFSDCPIHGITLARMARYKRPGIQILFTALPEFREDAADLGEFMLLSTSAPEVATAVERMLETDDLPLC